MKRIEVDNKFTQKVTEYLVKGYTFHTDSMGGSQGEIAKVDLVKGDDLIRIYMDMKYENFISRDPNVWTGNIVFVCVSRWKYKTSGYHIGSTIWTNDCEDIEVIKYYKVDDDWYLDNLEDALEIQRLRMRRFPHHNHYLNSNTIMTNERAKEIGSKFLKRTQGYQRVSKDKISIQKKVYRNDHPSYYVVYRGESYHLR